MIKDCQNQKPFFSARVVNAQVQTQGETHCLLGHIIDETQSKTPDGVFAQWQWDGKTLTVTHDRFGFYPVYYYHDENSIVISPSLIRMMPFCRKRNMDGTALAVYLRTGSFIGNDTPFVHIKALGPNETLKWNQGRITLTGGEIIIPKQMNIPRQEAKKEFSRLFAQAISKRRPKTNSFVIPLSGGRDSRHILFELLKQNMRPEYCVTFEDFPDWRGEDLPVAKAIVKETGLKHVVIKQDRSRFDCEFMKNRLAGLCASRHVKMLTMAEYLNTHAQTTYDGIAGSLVQSFLNEQNDINLYIDDDLNPLTNSFLKKWTSGEDAYQLALNPETYQLIHFDKAFARLKEEITIHKNAPNPITSYYFWNRQRRDISLIPYAMLGDIPYVYSPYLDHDLCKFLLSLPVNIIEGGTFHDEVIREDYPQYAHIPFEDKSIPNPKAEAHWSQFARDFSIYYFKSMAFRSKLLNNTFLAPRLLRCLVDKRYCLTTTWIPFTRILNLMQLEEITHSNSL